MKEKNDNSSDHDCSKGHGQGGRGRNNKKEQNPKQVQEKVDIRGQRYNCSHVQYYYYIKKKDHYDSKCYYNKNNKLEIY